MANKMLIDATHPEETRVAVVRGNRIEEFDFESASKKPLKGNIYLAKVIRVEPSLQAAFVEYGGNRHGFLAFSEIHPDYYQIPVADRERLIAEYARLAIEADEIDEDRQHQERNENSEHNDIVRNRDLNRNGRSRHRSRSRFKTEIDAVITEQVAAELSEIPIHSHSEFDDVAEMLEHSLENTPEIFDTPQETAIIEAEIKAEIAAEQEPQHLEPTDQVQDDNEQQTLQRVETVNSHTDVMDEIPDRQIRRMVKSYKIQEVIKKRQVMLIQVVKEERGNKGAALTTYLSLAGRYAVLMPNTARGGGISRKIASGEDRRRLKEVANELEVPEGMGLIIRTAGANRTKVEIKRDYDYLLRVWDTVRDLTLSSQAPALVYEEGSLIKRSLRDLYGKEVDEVIVDGENAYTEAKAFMKMLMPSHAKNVIHYKETIPLFAKYGVETQLEVMFQNQVSLRSGGYLVINQTEALVAVDVNSGRSTKEHNIEDTALKTNLEAADEVARQLRLRDLAGLVVIDFIDMEDKRNNKAVERRLKEALNQDRARIQVGFISAFGLLEMSRQRLRTSVLESTTVQCPQCSGLGYVRSTSSTALLILRAIEAALIKDGRLGLTVRTATANALYLLNQKRNSLNELEARYGVHVIVEADDKLDSGINYAIDRTVLVGEQANAVLIAQQNRSAQQIALRNSERTSTGATLFPDVQSDNETLEIHSDPRETVSLPDDDEVPKRKKRRRRRRGRGSRDENGNFIRNTDGSIQQNEQDETDDGDEEFEGDDSQFENSTDIALFSTKPLLENERDSFAAAPLLQASTVPSIRRPKPQFVGQTIEPNEATEISSDETASLQPRTRRDQFGRQRLLRAKTNMPAEFAPPEPLPIPQDNTAVETNATTIEAEISNTKLAKKPRLTAAQKAAAREAEALNLVEQEASKILSNAPISQITSIEPEKPQMPTKKGWWSKKLLG